MAWRREVRLLSEYSSHVTFRFDVMALVGIVAGVVLVVMGSGVASLLLSIVSIAYLLLRLRGVQKLARMDFERGGTVLRAHAHVVFGEAPVPVGVHPGQPVVVDVGGEMVDAVCRSGTVLLGRSGGVTLERVDGSVWPAMMRGDHLDVVSVSGTVGGVLVADVMRDPGRAWLPRSGGSDDGR